MQKCDSDQQNLNEFHVIKKIKKTKIFNRETSTHNVNVDAFFINPPILKAVLGKDMCPVQSLAVIGVNMLEFVSNGVNAAAHILMYKYEASSALISSNHFP